MREILSLGVFDVAISKTWQRMVSGPSANCRAPSEVFDVTVISQASVAKYLVRHPKPPSQTWRTFLANHMSQLASIDFFTVHTIWFEILCP